MLLNIVSTTAIATAIFGIVDAVALPQTSGTELTAALLKGMGGSVPLGPAPKGCSKYEIIVARGTGEPGPFGAIVGDPLVAAVTKAIPESRGYAVQYPANLNWTLSPAIGADDTINRLNNQNKACPDQKFALVGYSQGAGVMHAAMSPSGKIFPGLANPRPKINDSAMSKIVAIVMFGDPGFKGGSNSTTPAFPTTIQKIVKQNCAVGDPACDPKGSGWQYHLKYNSTPYQPESVAFIEAGFKGLPLPKAITSTSDPAWISLAEGGKPGSF